MKRVCVNNSFGHLIQIIGRVAICKLDNKKVVTVNINELIFMGI